ncbi:MAG TPA: diguanylate cyclase, partial [Longimicrobium sp.]
MTDFRDAGPWFTEGPAMLAAVSPAGTIVAASRAAASLVGRTPEELEGTAFTALYHPEDRPAVCAGHTEALAAPGTDVRRAVRRLRADGGVLRLEETLRAIQGTGGTVVLIHTQNAPLRRADGGPGAGDERYALALEGATEGLWDWDVQARRLSPSPRLMALLGYAEGEVGPDPAEWLARIHPEDVEHVRTSLAALRSGERPYVESVHRMRHRDGSWRWAHVRAVAVMGENGAAVRVAGSLSDVTDRKVAEELLLHNALHDALTGLPNRTLLLDRVGLALRRGARLGRSCAVLCVGLDGFKVINDSLGHAVGDLLLQSVARRLENAMRSADTVARLGADVFAVLVDELRDPSEARAVADRVHDALAEPFTLQGRAVFATVSIGIAGGGGDGAAEVLVRDAETAMYRAKKRGRAGSEMFDATMQATALQRLHLETDLRGAVEREEFELAYQPVVSLADGRIAG